MLGIILWMRKSSLPVLPEDIHIFMDSGAYMRLGIAHVALAVSTHEPWTGRRRVQLRVVRFNGPNTVRAESRAGQKECTSYSRRTRINLVPLCIIRTW